MTWMEEHWASWLAARLKETLPGLRVEEMAPMSNYTSFRIGGPAALLVFPRTADEVRKVLGLSRSCQKTPILMGKGSDMLVADGGLDVPVLRMTEMNAVRPLDDCTLLAEAGISLASLAVSAWKRGLTGLEFAHGIPGTLGGGILMNAGAYEGEMKQVVKSVTALDLSSRNFQLVTLSARECEFAYRHSRFSRGDLLILSAEIALQKGDSAAIREKMDDLMARRKASQPLDYPSAGSVFKRPEGYFAGTLIEQAGLKGLQVGGAQVSPKHAGFIVNVGGATAADVKQLIAQIQKTIREKDGVELEPEVKFIG